MRDSAIAECFAGSLKRNTDDHLLASLDACFWPNSARRRGTQSAPLEPLLRRRPPAQSALSLCSISDRQPPTLNPALASATGSSGKIKSNWPLALIQQAPAAIKSVASPKKPVALLYFLPLPQRRGALRQDMWRCCARRQKGRQPSAGPAGCAAGLVAFAKTPAASSPLNRPPLLSHWPERHRVPSDQSAPRWRH